MPAGRDVGMLERPAEKHSPDLLSETRIILNRRCLSCMIEMYDCKCWWKKCEKRPRHYIEIVGGNILFRNVEKPWKVSCRYSGQQYTSEIRWKPLLFPIPFWTTIIKVQFVKIHIFQKSRNRQLPCVTGLYSIPITLQQATDIGGSIHCLLRLSSPPSSW